MTPSPKVIAQLESDASILAKKAIVKQQVLDNNIEFFEGVRFAYDNLITFGVKKVPEHLGTAGAGLAWDAFKALLAQLVSRELTGHAARDAIEAAMNLSNPEQWNMWYRRILIKDLRCGTSDTIVNSVVKECERSEFAVPVFECQLAKDGAQHEKKLVGVKLIDGKYDGVRCLTVINVESRTVTQFSRNGQLLENFSHITTALTEHIDDFERSWVLDGEMMSRDFQQLMTQLKRKKNADASDSVLHLFDIVPLSEFRQGKSTMRQRARTNLLKTFKAIFAKTGCIEIVEPEEVDLDTAVGQTQFQEINKKAINDGLEGIMLKDPNAPYECKRGTSWLKLKPFITVDLAIVAIEEGTGKYEGMLGAIVCEGEDDGRKIRVNVGSGITDDQRAEWFLNSAALLRQIVEIKADAVTQNQDGTYSLRFPRFERFRGFKAMEKI